MSNRDFCLLGLVALSVVLVDTLAVGRLRAGRDRGGDAMPGRPAPAAGCPRHAGHRSLGRADGAIWCLHCDEAFYPHATEWDRALTAAA